MIDNLKKEIGKRIFEARKAKGLTLKALGELTAGLKQTRLTNWEKGLRTPGPEAIKLLAKALDISPAYLMCLSDEKKPLHLAQRIPLLDCAQVAEITFSNRKLSTRSDNALFISIHNPLVAGLSQAAFAVSWVGEAVVPDIQKNDLLIIDPNRPQGSGDYLMVKITKTKEIIVCQNKKSNNMSDSHNLLCLNDKVSNVALIDPQTVQIIGKVVQKIRQYP